MGLWRALRHLVEGCRSGSIITSGYFYDKNMIGKEVRVDWSVVKCFQCRCPYLEMEDTPIKSASKYNPKDLMI